MPGRPSGSDLSLDSDRELFLRTLAEAGERSGMVIHSYVLMTSHYHLLAETPKPDAITHIRPITD